MKSLEFFGLEFLTIYIFEIETMSV